MWVAYIVMKVTNALVTVEFVICKTYMMQHNKILRLILNIVKKLLNID